MARIVNEAAHAARRNAILDAAERLIATKGYEQMAISDVVSELHISSGAFYHYFESKPALLMSVVKRIVDHLEQLVLPIINDPALNALDKFQRVFAVMDAQKIESRAFVVSYLRTWYGDENAIVRQKIYVERVRRISPWLRQIIEQGVAEGVMTAPYPDQTARIVCALLEDFGQASVSFVLSGAIEPEDLSRYRRVVAASADALERVLGVQTGFIQDYWQRGLDPWIAKL